VSHADRRFQREKWETERADAARLREAERDLPDYERLLGVVSAGDRDLLLKGNEQALITYMGVTAAVVSPMLLDDDNPVYRAWKDMVQALGEISFSPEPDALTNPQKRADLVNTRAELMQALFREIRRLKS
jgi:hypothetical protein